VLLGDFRAAFDVREQEGDRAGREAGGQVGYSGEWASERVYATFGPYCPPVWV
jgi:hypothetical protein